MGCWGYGMDPTRVSSLPLPCIFVAHAGGKVPAAKVTGAFSLAHGLEDALKRTNCQKGRVTGARWIISGIF